MCVRERAEDCLGADVCHSDAHNGWRERERECVCVCVCVCVREREGVR